MAFNTGNSSGASAEINVTPLIDVLLVLLIIFMVLVPIAPHGLSTLLPQPSREEAESTPELPLVVEVTAGADGAIAYSLNRQHLTAAALRGELGRQMSTRREKAMFVRGDSKLEFSSIAAVISLGRDANAERIGILTPGLLETRR